MTVAPGRPEPEVTEDAPAARAPAAIPDPWARQRSRLADRIDERTAAAPAPAPRPTVPRSTDTLTVGERLAWVGMMYLGGATAVLVAGLVLWLLGVVALLIVVAVAAVGVGGYRLLRLVGVPSRPRWHVWTPPPSSLSGMAPTGTTEVRRFPWADRFEELPSGCLVWLVVTVVVWVPLLLVGLVLAFRVSMR